jgi:hypothetical protein
MSEKHKVIVLIVLAIVFMISIPVMESRFYPDGEIFSQEQDILIFLKIVVAFITGILASKYLNIWVKSESMEPESSH